MKQEIWKFPLRGWSSRIEMPVGAEILTVQVQHGVACIWALCDPKKEQVEREIVVIGTGHPFEPIGKVYLGTYQEMGGSLVWHVFEVIEN